MNYIERAIVSQDWITLLLTGCFILFAMVSILYKKRYEDFIKLPISSNYFIGRYTSDEIKHPFNLVLFMIQVISISLFINLFFSEELKNDSGLFIQIIIGVFVFISIKFLIEKMLGTIFSMEGIINQYVFQKFAYRSFASILIFVANLFFYFTFQPSLNTLLVFTSVLVFLNVAVIFYSLKNYRTLLFSNFFYFLLYLCTLEISPYFLVYKALI